MTTTKKILAKVDLGLGNSAWVEKTSYGVICTKADLHPDDPIVTMFIGTARQSYRAMQSVYRAKRSNWRGKIAFSNHRKVRWNIDSQLKEIGLEWQ